MGRRLLAVEVVCGRLSLPEFLASLVQVGGVGAVGWRLTECAVAGGIGASLAASGGRGRWASGWFWGGCFGAVAMMTSE